MCVPFLLACVALWACGAGAPSYNETAGLDLCRDYRVAFERVFTVPQEAALLTCHLVNKHLFDVGNTPYNVTWYNQRTGLQITGEDGDGTVVKGASLWFLNSTVEHQGKYLCVVRTPENCYKQAVVLEVSQPKPQDCGRPQTALQTLKSSVNDNLACPLNDYAAKVTSFSIQWYKGCELLQEGPKFAFIGNKLLLLIRDVSLGDAGLYTCRMTFALDGVVSEVAETIECMISGNSTTDLASREQDEHGLAAEVEQLGAHRGRSPEKQTGPNTRKSHRTKGEYRGGERG